MITLIHGDNVEASRAELLRMRQTATEKEIRELSGRNVDATMLTQALTSSSFFDHQTMVIIEHLFGKLGRKTKLIEQFGHIITSAGESTDIILWEDKTMGVTVTKNLGKAMIKTYKMPVLVFQFLDQLSPGRQSQCLSIFSQIIKSEVPEILFTMITRRVRHLMQLSVGVTPLGLQSWQATRLTNQARLFTMSKLVSMHSELLAIEIATKTGASPYTLTQQLEQFIIRL